MILRCFCRGVFFGLFSEKVLWFSVFDNQSWQNDQLKNQLCCSYTVKVCWQIQKSKELFPTCLIVLRTPGKDSKGKEFLVFRSSGHFTIIPENPTNHLKERQVHRFYRCSQGRVCSQLPKDWKIAIEVQEHDIEGASTCRLCCFCCWCCRCCRFFVVVATTSLQANSLLVVGHLFSQPGTDLLLLVYSSIFCVMSCLFPPHKVYIYFGWACNFTWSMSTTRLQKTTWPVNCVSQSNSDIMLHPTHNIVVNYTMCLARVNVFFKMKMMYKSRKVNIL